MYNQNIVHNMIVVDLLNKENEHYGLYWAGDDGNNQVYICSVYGTDNAIEVANRIAHEQVEFVRHSGGLIR